MSAFIYGFVLIVLISFPQNPVDIWMVAVAAVRTTDDGDRYYHPGDTVYDGNSDNFNFNSDEKKIGGKTKMNKKARGVYGTVSLCKQFG